MIFWTNCKLDFPIDSFASCFIYTPSLPIYFYYYFIVISYEDHLVLVENDYEIKTNRPT